MRTQVRHRIVNVTLWAASAWLTIAVLVGSPLPRWVWALLDRQQPPDRGVTLGCPSRSPQFGLPCQLPAGHASGHRNDVVWWAQGQGYGVA